jgi:hypothetical protein
MSAALAGLAGCSHAQKEGVNVEQNDAKSDRKDQSPPTLTNAQTRKIWIKPKIDGSKYEEGHYVFIIERGSEWISPSE